MSTNRIIGIEDFPQIVKMLNIKKALLVAGSSYKSLVIKEVIDSMELEQVLFSDFTPNPLYEDVCKGIDLLKSEKCDSIIAVGGGSAIDVAKCIKLAYLAAEGNTAIIPPLVNTRIECDSSKLPLIAIPTTAGTGSESTHNAVMYFEGSKQTVTNDGILPDFAILEPSVLNSLPLYQKKCTMMDALCQSIESWWSINSTEESYGYSKKSIELIMQNWRAYIFDNNSNAATNIMNAANYSGRAINITATTAAHAMSYKITSIYGLPHGHAVAVCLPEIWLYMIEHMEECIDSRGQKYLANTFNGIANSMGAKSPKEAICMFKNMMKEQNLKNPCSTNRNNDISILSTSVNPIRLKNNPVFLDSETIKGLYETIVK